MALWSEVGTEDRVETRIGPEVHRLDEIGEMVLLVDGGRECIALFAKVLGHELAVAAVEQQVETGGRAAAQRVRILHEFHRCEPAPDRPFEEQAHVPAAVLVRQVGFEIEEIDLGVVVLHRTPTKRWRV